ncbi:hypothetical protein BB558_005018 [Smittium angustum]|uniref:Sfi1 spindle body domain-containing protein n=1 Tax=Smittium angustum TaxID=133377 RepID=A0A2U1J1L3_SMIAN|nr:hypothetical protein BB558_005018 [Smittium angustum]
MSVYNSKLELKSVLRLGDLLQSVPEREITFEEYNSKKRIQLICLWSIAVEFSFKMQAIKTIGIWRKKLLQKKEKDSFLIHRTIDDTYNYSLDFSERSFGNLISNIRNIDIFQKNFVEQSVKFNSYNDMIVDHNSTISRDIKPHAHLQLNIEEDYDNRIERSNSNTRQNNKTYSSSSTNLKPAGLYYIFNRWKKHTLLQEIHNHFKHIKKNQTIYQSLKIWRKRTKEIQRHKKLIFNMKQIDRSNNDRNIELVKIHFKKWFEVSRLISLEKKWQDIRFLSLKNETIYNTKTYDMELSDENMVFLFNNSFSTKIHSFHIWFYWFSLNQKFKIAEKKYASNTISTAFKKIRYQIHNFSDKAESAINFRNKKLALHCINLWKSNSKKVRTLNNKVFEFHMVKIKKSLAGNIDDKNKPYFQTPNVVKEDVDLPHHFKSTLSIELKKWNALRKKFNDNEILIPKTQGPIHSILQSDPENVSHSEESPKKLQVITNYPKLSLESYSQLSKLKSQRIVKQAFSKLKEKQNFICDSLKMAEIHSNTNDLRFCFTKWRNKADNIKKTKKFFSLLPAAIVTSIAIQKKIVLDESLTKNRLLLGKRLCLKFFKFMKTISISYKKNIHLAEKFNEYSLILYFDKWHTNYKLKAEKYKTHENTESYTPKSNIYDNCNSVTVNEYKLNDETQYMIKNQTSCDFHESFLEKRDPINLDSPPIQTTPPKNSNKSEKSNNSYKPNSNTVPKDSLLVSPENNSNAKSSNLLKPRYPTLEKNVYRTTRNNKNKKLVRKNSYFPNNLRQDNRKYKNSSFPKDPKKLFEKSNQHQIFESGTKHQYKITHNTNRKTSIGKLYEKESKNVHGLDDYIIKYTIYQRKLHKGDKITKKKSRSKSKASRSQLHRSRKSSTQKNTFLEENRKNVGIFEKVYPYLLEKSNSYVSNDDVCNTDKKLECLNAPQIELTIPTSPAFFFSFLEIGELESNVTLTESKPNEKLNVSDFKENDDNFYSKSVGKHDIKNVTKDVVSNYESAKSSELYLNTEIFDVYEYQHTNNDLYLNLASLSLKENTSDPNILKSDGFNNSKIGSSSFTNVYQHDLQYFLNTRSNSRNTAKSISYKRTNQFTNISRSDSSPVAGSDYTVFDSDSQHLLGGKIYARIKTSNLLSSKNTFSQTIETLGSRSKENLKEHNTALINYKTKLEIDISRRVLEKWRNLALINSTENLKFKKTRFESVLESRALVSAFHKWCSKLQNIQSANRTSIYHYKRIVLQRLLLAYERSLARKKILVNENLNIPLLDGSSLDFQRIQNILQLQRSTNGLQVLSDAFTFWYSHTTDALIYKMKLTKQFQDAQKKTVLLRYLRLWLRNYIVKKLFRTKENSINTFNESISFETDNNPSKYHIGMGFRENMIKSFEEPQLGNYNIGELVGMRSHGSFVDEFKQSINESWEENYQYYNDESNCYVAENLSNDEIGYSVNYSSFPIPKAQETSKPDLDTYSCTFKSTRHDELELEKVADAFWFSSLASKFLLRMTDIMYERQISSLTTKFEEISIENKTVAENIDENNVTSLQEPNFNSEIVKNNIELPEYTIHKIIPVGNVYSTSKGDSPKQDGDAEFNLNDIESSNNRIETFENSAIIENPENSDNHINYNKETRIKLNLVSALFRRRKLLRMSVSSWIKKSNNINVNVYCHIKSLREAIRNINDGETISDVSEYDSTSLVRKSQDGINCALIDDVMYKLVDQVSDPFNRKKTLSLAFRKWKKAALKRDRPVLNLRTIFADQWHKTNTNRKVFRCWRYRKRSLDKYRKITNLSNEHRTKLNLKEI